jgi:hypothetical protein
MLGTEMRCNSRVCMANGRTVKGAMRVSTVAWHWLTAAT